MMSAVPDRDDEYRTLIPVGHGSRVRLIEIRAYTEQVNRNRRVEPEGSPEIGVTTSDDGGAW